MAVDRIALNDAISTMLAMVGVTRVSDEQLNELTHRTADYLDEIEAEND